ncbi:glycosyltransferase [Myxococcota bacterium]|nr:glycosyltransferase [Myxococcota bacterium]
MKVGSVGVSAVVPVRLRGPHDREDLRACLQALAASEPPLEEIIVVDDGSTPAVGPTSDLLDRRGLRLLRTTPGGPAAARNAGAAVAGGQLIAFVDADVRVPPDAVTRLVSHLLARPDAVAAWATVSARPPVDGLLTRYKNHTHRHFTLRLGAGPGPWSTSHLTTMLAVVRRTALEEVGGFRRALSTVSVEDVELGRDLVDAGGVVLLDPTVQVAHAHRFRPVGTVRNDAHKLRRLVTAELARGAGPSIAPDSPASRRMRAYARGAPLGALAAVATVTGAWPLAVPLGAAFAWAERDLLTYLAREEGPAFAVACLPWMAVERVTAGLAGLAGAWDHLRQQGR